MANIEFHNVPKKIIDSLSQALIRRDCPLDGGISYSQLKTGTRTISIRSNNDEITLFQGDASLKWEDNQ